MITLFFILVGFAAFHFIYEGIILPNLRIEIRYGIFALRDRIRALKCEHHDQLNHDVFNLLNQSANGSISNIPNLNIANIIEANMQIRKNGALQKELERRMQIINDCQVEEVKHISTEIHKLSLIAFVANSGGWAPMIPILLLPIIIFFIIVFLLKQFFSWNASLKQAFFQLAYLKADELQNVFKGDVKARWKRVKEKAKADKKKK